MIPYCDLFNHSFDAEVEWSYDDQSKCFEYRAISDISRGQEINITYGRKANYNFFLMYGFICLPNEQEHVQLKIGLNSQDFDQKVVFC